MAIHIVIIRNNFNFHEDTVVVCSIYFIIFSKNKNEIFFTFIFFSLSLRIYSISNRMNNFQRIEKRLSIGIFFNQKNIIVQVAISN